MDTPYQKVIIMISLILLVCLEIRVSKISKIVFFLKLLLHKWANISNMLIDSTLKLQFHLHKFHLC